MGGVMSERQGEKWRAQDRPMSGVSCVRREGSQVFLDLFGYVYREKAVLIAARVAQAINEWEVRYGGRIDDFGGGKSDE